ncbi:hypothetical protein BABA_02177 [Neobacillus bataviensis LMG 21833]|uniref:Protein NO VEIN C-terminal domain-containing protein n=1 Tax=Neobacillus bataviensis LMG 21833 TaxID=1117379 RepID=K6ECX7_9BACI|nr:DUF3883 domain-containing protein [Neobacillus bataviensis]EKN71301.1 hypothetical protein BABA_02177 [Neobacillus bataviensis LMG 21833]
MAIKDKLNAEDIEALLSENSKQVIENFLTYYGDSSKANMRSSVYRLLYHELVKDDVSKVNFEDYLKIFPNGGKNLSTQKIYRHSFFKFLYAFDHMKMPFGFETIWIKEHENKQFIQLKERKEKVTKEKPRKTLTIEELTKIQKVIETESTKLETLKIQFCWYCIFELGIDVDELKLNITSDNFSDGILIAKEGSIKLPEKFHYMFEMLKERDERNGFATLNDLFENLGQYAKLERKLLPVMVKLTRKDYMVTCGNCGKKYTNLSHNWRSVNNRIVCLDCAESLKKKLNFEVEVVDIENTNLNDSDNNELSFLYAYADLKRKIQSKPIDFLKLHELQIEIGELGEKYVYERECKNLMGTKYINMVDDSIAGNPKNGYDILSYTRDGKPLHIEVKTTSGSEDKFFLSNNELQTAKKMKDEGLIYVVYFVKRILSDNPELNIIGDISMNKEYVLEELRSWKVTKVH